jgi:hemerythrin superfamily protein
MTYKEEREQGKEKEKIAKVGTRCKMDNKVFEVVEIEPYSDVCDTPLYKMIVIDDKSIETLKQELIRDNKRSKCTEEFTEEELLQYRTISEIEPAWFITRNAVILN